MEEVPERPHIDKEQSFHMPMSTWRKILDGVKPYGKQSVAGPGWSKLFNLPKTTFKCFPFCQFPRGGLKLLIRANHSGKSTYYASLMTKCVAKKKDGSRCDCVMRVYLLDEPDPEAKEVEWAVVWEEGDTVDSHWDPGSIDGPNFFRYNKTGDERQELKEYVASSNKSFKEIASELSKAAEAEGSLVTGNLTEAPTVDALKHRTSRLLSQALAFKT